MFIIFQVGFRIWILVFDAIFDQTVEENKICPAVFSAILVFIRTYVLIVFRVAEILLQQFCCRKKAILITKSYL